MRNTYTWLKSFLLSALLIGSFASSAQYNIQINQTPSLDKLCMGLPGVSYYLRLYNGTTHVTNGVTFYISGANSLSQQGSVTSLSCPLVQYVYPITTPGNVHTTAYFYGTATIYAIMNNCVAAQKTITIYPDNLQNIAGALTGPDEIGTQGVYTPSSAPFASGSTLSGTPYVNGYLAPFYDVNLSGNSVVVVPHEDAPLSPLVKVTTVFQPVGSVCAPYNPQGYDSFTRKPVATVTGLTNNVMCPFSTINLNVNVQDYSGYPGIPSGNSTVKHFTYQWYLNGSPISGATGKTHSTTTAGSYYVAVTEYGQTWNGSAYQWNASPTITKNSNTIAVNAPSSTAPTPSFTINGVAPGLSAPGPNNFNCHPIMFASTSTGTIGWYRIEIRDANNNALLHDYSANGTPPTQNLAPLMNGGNPVTGAFKLKLTLSTGCPGYAQSSIERYFYVTAGPAGSLVSKTTTTNNSFVDVTYNPSSTNPGSPNKVGRYSTIFNWTGSYGTGATVCSYVLKLYKWNGSSWGIAVWNQTFNAPPGCPSGTIAQKPMGLIGGSGYMQNLANAPNNSIWKIEAVLTNNCGNTTITNVFQMDDANYQRPAGEEENEEIFAAEVAGVKFLPVPFRDELTACLSLAEPSRVSLQIYTIDGKLMQDVWSNEAIDQSASRRAINTSTWPSGMFFYKLTVNGKASSGKLIKQ